MGCSVYFSPHHILYNIGSEFVKFGDFTIDFRPNNEALKPYKLRFFRFAPLVPCKACRPLY